MRTNPDSARLLACALRCQARAALQFPYVFFSALGTGCALCIQAATATGSATTAVAICLAAVAVDLAVRLPGIARSLQLKQVAGLRSIACSMQLTPWLRCRRWWWFCCPGACAGAGADAHGISLRDDAPAMIVLDPSQPAGLCCWGVPLRIGS